MSGWTYVGIDISAKKVDFHIKNRQDQIRRGTIKNHPPGHQHLLHILTRRKGPVRVCLESTGVYGIDLAVALARHPRVQVSVINPRQAKRFADALKKRSKTDSIDAEVLCEYAERMDFEAWEPPHRAAMQLRALGRRLHQLTQIKTQEKNRLHAAMSTEELAIVRPRIERSIESLEAQIEETQRAAMEIVNSETEVRRSFDHLCSVKGIAERSAVKILGEINVLPNDMTHRQWVAHAGLDPRHHDSGTSVHQPPKISKQGNKYLRAALYMPAHTASRFEPGVKRFYDRLLSRGKATMQAKVAVMRKLLHAIYGMLKHDEDFDGARFTPVEKGAQKA